MAKLSVILMDDSSEASAGLAEFLAKAGFPITMAGDPSEVFSRQEDKSFGVFCIHTDSCRDILPFIAKFSHRYSQLPVVVLSRRSSVDEAVAVTRAGAWDYVENMDAVLQTLQSIDSASVSKPGRPRSKKGSPRGNGREGGICDIIGESREIEKVFDLIEKVADTDSTILIQGESGTGKELIAKALHFEGERHVGPFVPVNCGAIPGELLESELFGHEKGAFTHAVRTRIGRFELANGGTVFLDEIAEMSPMLQVKLLRVLQERQFERVGGAKTIHSDFRVIAATNRDLEAEVKNGRFREDLFYRLNVIQIEAPPLRQRVSDIPLLSKYFIERYNQYRKRTITGFSSDAMQAMYEYPWPGNVRELENVIERLVILAPGDGIVLEDLPERFLNLSGVTSGAKVILTDEGLRLSDVVTEFEMGIIEQALKRTKWVKNRAAKLLQINRTTLIEKMKRYNMVKPEETDEMTSSVVSSLNSRINSRL